jgi:hypothetical protein
MIGDMALLKRTMQQMDAEDPIAAQAAKDHAAQILGEAKLNFSKMAQLIEQRRLLLPPAILGRIKKMDQPGMLGDGAFQDTGTALRREGLSFLQIAEAIEANDRPAPAPRYEAPASESEPYFVMEDEPGAPAWLRALLFIGRIVLFPVRHPLRSLAIGLFALILLYAVRGVVVLSEWANGYSRSAAAIHRVDTAIASVKSFVNERISPQAKETPPTPDAPVPSPTAAADAPPSANPPAAPAPSPSPPAPSAAPATAAAPSTAPSPAPTIAKAPPATVPAPGSNESAARAPPSVAPARPQAAPTNVPDWTARRDARGASPSRSAARRPQAFDDTAEYRRDSTAEYRRDSHVAGPCRGGIGGCYWGGGRF